MFKSFWFYFNSIPFALGIILIIISLVMFLFSDINTHHGYMQNECLGKNATDLDSEGWSEMDFCIDKHQSEDLGYFFLMFAAGMLGFIFIIPLSIYLLLSWRMQRYGHY
jgi:hypothetical protein